MLRSGGLDGIGEAVHPAVLRVKARMNLVDHGELEMAAPITRLRAVGGLSGSVAGNTLREI